MSPDVVLRDTDLGQRQVNMTPRTRSRAREPIPLNKAPSRPVARASEIGDNPF